jgi:predicted transcriptional regulator
MKSATLPPLRVEPAVRHAAERELRDDETLSSFVEKAVRELIERRRSQREFIQRGLESARKAERTGVTFGVDEVMGSLERLTAKAARPRRSGSRARR